MADVARKDRLVADHRKGAAEFRSEVDSAGPPNPAVAARQDGRERRDAESGRRAPAKRQVFAERHEVVLVIDRGERPVGPDEREAVAGPEILDPLRADQAPARLRRRPKAARARRRIGRAGREGSFPARSRGRGAKLGVRGAAVRSRPRCQKTGIMSGCHFRCCGAFGWIRRMTGASGRRRARARKAGGTKGTASTASAATATGQRRRTRIRHAGPKRPRRRPPERQAMRPVMRTKGARACRSARVPERPTESPSGPFPAPPRPG
jgi:hypothetical protein